MLETISCSSTLSWNSLYSCGTKMKVLATWLLSFSLVLIIASAFKTVTFTTKDGTRKTYGTFLTEMRDALTGSTVHDFPVLLQQSEITDKNMFVLAELHNNENKQITVAVNASNAYLIAFRTGNKSFFCSDNKPSARRLLFVDTTQTNLIMTSDYPGEPKREHVALGIMEILSDAIGIFSDFHGGDEGFRFRYNFVVLIEMIAEAARFKFIEKQILQSTANSYYPRNDTISLEDNWGALSDRIHQSVGGQFPTSVRLMNADGSPRIVSRIEDIRPDISLLKPLTLRNFGEVA